MTIIDSSVTANKCDSKSVSSELKNREEGIKIFVRGYLQVLARWLSRYAKQQLDCRPVYALIKHLERPGIVPLLLSPG